MKTIEQGIQQYRDELTANPERRHAQRGLYRFSRRKAEIWILLGNYSQAAALIRSAEKLTLDEEWGNPFEIAILISRSMPLLQSSDDFDDDARAAEQETMARLAVANLRKALEFDCPPNEILGVRNDLKHLEFWPGFQALMSELEAP